MGFRPAGSEGNRFRYHATGGEGFAATADLLRVPDTRQGIVGAGVVHHIAFRTPDDRQQEAWRQRLADLGYDVTPVIDRQYFHSIYYREPGGVLFEIATDPPGFTVDQKPEELGMRLMLPPWLEPYRAEIERVLPPVHLHAEPHQV
jgi:glyoxalase family protein